MILVLLWGKDALSSKVKKDKVLLIRAKSLKNFLFPFWGPPSIWVRNFERCTIGIFRPWALLLHLVRPQLLRNHFFLVSSVKSTNRAFRKHILYIPLLIFCTSHGPPNAKKWQKVMFFTLFHFSEPSCNFQALTIVSMWYVLGLYHKKLEVLEQISGHKVQLESKSHKKRTSVSIMFQLPPQIVTWLLKQ